MQVRSVECFDSHGLHNTQCEPSTRPTSFQVCSTGIPCSSSEAPTTEVEDGSVSTSESNFNLKDDQNDDSIEENKKTDKKLNIPSFAENVDENEEYKDETDIQGDEPMDKEGNHKLPLAYQFRIPRAERLVDLNAPNEPT